MQFLKVPRKQAEKIRRELIEKDLFSNEYSIFTEGDFVFLPVKKKWKNFEIIEKDVEKLPSHTLKLEKELSQFLNEEEMGSVCTSFDIIGDIAIIEIPGNLVTKEKKIGEAILKVHKNVKTVLKKASAMEGKYRLRKLKLIAGVDKTETIYKEHECRMKLDVFKVYFSIRLSHERGRIAELVKDGEKILALFAGVGPFPLVISKKHPETEIVAIELNPDAVKYMEENARLNNASNIRVIQGDARNVVLNYFTDYADRVLMPLPLSSETFLDIAFAGAKSGATIHFYTMVDIKNPFEEAIAKAKEAAIAHNVQIEILSKRIIRSYSPSIVQVVLDLKVRKNNHQIAGK